MLSLVPLPVNQYYFRWTQKSHVGIWQQRGYEVYQHEGAIELFADLVLMCCPRESYLSSLDDFLKEAEEIKKLKQLIFSEEYASS